jgi:peptidoglycan-N-acetylglucosamine deacetylase
VEACFTVDMEPDCPPYLSGWRGIDEGAPALLALLGRHRIPSTMFVTGALVRRDPDRVRAWAEAGHELGCHGDAHVRYSLQSRPAAYEDLARATETLSRFGPVRSFRAPNLDLPPWLLPRLAQLGYAIDSSEGRHKHLRARVRREAGLLRIPASTTSSLLRLPPALVAPILSLLPSPLVLFVHPWELVDLRRERLRFDCRARTGPPALAALDGLFHRLTEAGYRWTRLCDLAAGSLVVDSAEGAV